MAHRLRARKRRSVLTGSGPTTILARTRDIERVPGVVGDDVGIVDLLAWRRFADDETHQLDAAEALRRARQILSFTIALADKHLP